MINDIVNNGFRPTVSAAKNDSPTIPVSNAPSPIVKAAVQAKQAEAVDPVKLNEAISKLNDYVQNVQRTLSFSISKETGRSIIKVYDSETHELIRQIPPEETLKLAESLLDRTSSLFVTEQA